MISRIVFHALAQGIAYGIFIGELNPFFHTQQIDTISLAYCQTLGIKSLNKGSHLFRHIAIKPEHLVTLDGSGIEEQHTGVEHGSYILQTGT